MAKTKNEKMVSVDGVEYKLEDLSDNAIAQIDNLQFVEMQLQQLNNEWAVADTARIGYTNALKADLKKTNESE